MAHFSAQKLILVSRFIPLWASYFALAGLFLVVWINPELIGWDGVGDLKTILWIEVLFLVVFVYLVSWLEFPGGFLFAAVTLVVAAFSLYGFGLLGGFSAVVVTFYMLSRIVGLWRDEKKMAVEFRQVVIALSILGGSWLLIQLQQFPQFGWTGAATPRDLWWEVTGITGRRMITYGIPAWGVLYFGLSGVLELSKKIFYWMVQSSKAA